MKTLKEFQRENVSGMDLNKVKDLLAEMLATYLSNSLTVDDTKLCMSIRSRLAAKTDNFKWGLISGKHFGYEIDSEDPNTKLQGEYKFYYNVNDTAQQKCFHVLVYNKEGVYIPAMQGFLSKFKKNYSKIGFVKSALFCLMVLCYFWVSTTCRDYPNKPDSKGIKSDSIMDTVCEYKSALFFTMALGFVIVFTVGNVFKRITDMRQRRRAASTTTKKKL